MTILRSSDLQAHDGFGSSLALTRDYAVVGASGEDGGTGDPQTSAGAAYVFQRPSVWNQVRRLQAPDHAARDYFGSGVAIGTDYVAVGATGEDGGSCSPTLDAGAVYHFSTSSGWSHQATLRAPVLTEEAGFGGANGLSESLLLVGASDAGLEGTGSYKSGAAFLFEGSGRPGTASAHSYRTRVFRGMPSAVRSGFSMTRRSSATTRTAGVTSIGPTMRARSGSTDKASARATPSDADALRPTCLARAGLSPSLS